MGGRECLEVVTGRRKKTFIQALELVLSASGRLAG